MFFPCNDFGPHAVIWYDVMRMGKTKLPESGALDLSIVRQTLIRDAHTYLCVVTKNPRGRNLLALWQYLTIHTPRPTTDQLMDMFLAAATHGHLDVCQFLTDHFGKTSFVIRNDGFGPLQLERVSENIIRRGHTHVARWSIEYFGLTKIDWLTTFLICNCIVSQDLEFCKWIANRFELTAKDIRGYNNAPILTAATHGLLHICQWLVTTFGLTKRDARYAFRNAVHNGHLEVCQWLTERFRYDKYDPMSDMETGFTQLHYGPLWGPQSGLRLLDGTFHVDMCRWLTSYFGLTAQMLRSSGNQALTTAAFNGKADVCQWLVNHFQLKPQDVLDLNITVVIDYISQFVRFESV